MADVRQAFPDFLTVAEVAEAARVSRSTVNRWVNTGQVPSVRLGGVWRIRRTDIDRLLTEGTEPPRNRAAS